MALTERRYTPYFGVCHFNGGRYGTAVPSRDCTPRALPRASRSGRHVGLRPPRNDNSGAGSILTAAGTGCECSAGSGMPLPYNSRCGRRSATKPTACMALSERRYTPYFGVCHFNGGRYGTAVPSRDCHVGLRPPRNDNSGAGAVLAAAGTGCECSAGSGMPLPYNAYTKTPNGRGLRPGHGFYARREEGWKTCGGILLTFRASARGSWRSVRGSRWPAARGWPCRWHRRHR